MKIVVLNPPTKYTSNVVRDLVYGCWCKGKRVGKMEMPPTNLLSVGTVLKQNRFDIDLVEATINPESYKILLSEIDDYSVVIVLTSTTTLREDAGLLEELKGYNPQIKTIVFGGHPTFMPVSTLENDSIDIIAMREPEFIIRDVCKELSKNNSETWKGIKGIGYKEAGEVIINDPYPFADMDDLPILDRSLLPKDVYYFNPSVKKMPFTTMQTSRGCPAHCSFCTVPNFYGNKIRARSIDKIIEELHIIKAAGYNEVFIRDETFTIYRERNLELCNRIIEEKLNLSWICNARVGTVDRETLRMTKKAGCHMIKVGVESGVQSILDNLHKGIKVEDTRTLFEWAHSVGIDVHAHTMLGCPGETQETIEQTIKFVSELRPTTVTYGILTPYPGTELYKELKRICPELEDGTTCDLSRLHTREFFNERFTSLDNNTLESYLTKAYRSFYLNPGTILSLLLKVRSLEEAKRLGRAGLNIFDFSVRGE